MRLLGFMRKSIKPREYSVFISLGFDVVFYDNDFLEGIIDFKQGALSCWRFCSSGRANADCM